MKKRTLMRRGLEAALLSTILLLSSCYPDSISDVGETDLVVTDYNPDTSFVSLKTYAMPDEIIDLCQAAGECDEESISHEYDAEILGLIEDLMASRGYQRVSLDGASPAPDFGLLVGATTALNVVVGGGGCDWWYWYPWYPGYGCGGWYPWYPGYAYTYKTGTLVLDMVKALPDDPDQEIQFMGMWSAALNGVLGSTSTNLARLERGLRQAFEQSPYLRSEVETTLGGTR